jgi:hypothetical protein
MSDAPGSAAPAAPSGGDGGVASGTRGAHDSAPPPAAPRAPITRELSIDQAAKQLGEERREQRRREGREAARGANGAAPANGAPPPAAEAAAANGADGDRSVLDRLTEELAGERAGASGERGQATDGGQPDGEARHDAPAAPSDSYTLNINGVPQRFTAAQLEDHFHKASGFTQRMQDLAQRERNLQALQADIDRLKPMLLPEIERQVRELDSGIPENVDWVRLRAEDPERYDDLIARKLNLEQEQRRLATLTQQQQAEQQRRVTAQVEEGHRRIAEQLPMWADLQERARLTTDMRDWAHKQGFSDAELNNLTDYRQMMVMFRAMAHDNTAARIKAGGGAPRVPVVQRGSPPPQRRGDTAEMQTLRDRLAQTGSINDAAALLTLERRAQQRR